jgi:hypothetical protein
VNSNPQKLQIKPVALTFIPKRWSCCKKQKNVLKSIYGRRFQLTTLIKNKIFIGIVNTKKKRLVTALFIVTI